MTLPMIFISYYHANQNDVRNLATNLERLGYTTWYDRYLEGGQSWWNEILEQISKCSIFIILITSDSMRSEPCKAELHYAHQLKRFILPLMLENVNYDTLPATIRQLQIVDYQRKDTDAAFGLMSALREHTSPIPLPTPLPTSPSAPITEVAALATLLENEVLSAEDQMWLLEKLKKKIEVTTDPGSILELINRLDERLDLFQYTRDEIKRLSNELSIRTPKTKDLKGIDEVLDKFDTGIFVNLMSNDNVEHIRVLQTWMPNLQALKDAFHTAVTKDAQLQILLVRPSGPAADLRQLSMPKVQINRYLLDNLSVLAEIYDSLTGPQKQKFTVHVYDTPFSLSLYQVNNVSFVSLFLLNKLALDSLQIKITNAKSAWGKMVTDEFEAIWQHRRTKPVIFERDQWKQDFF